MLIYFVFVCKIWWNYTVPNGSSKMVSFRSSVEPPSCIIVISLSSRASDLRVSYNEGLWKMIPSVPPMQLNVNTHKRKRSKTIETNFHSWIIWSQKKNIWMNQGNIHSETTCITSLSLSASLICCAINRTPRNACNTSGVNLRGNMLSDSESAIVSSKRKNQLKKRKKNLY